MALMNLFQDCTSLLQNLRLCLTKVGLCLKLHRFGSRIVKSTATTSERKHYSPTSIHFSTVKSLYDVQNRKEVCGSLVRLIEKTKLFETNSAVIPQPPPKNL
jgi:hypothetical protein